MSYAAAWIAAAIVFAVVDAIWISQAGPRLYRPAIGEAMLESVRLAPAIAFYLIYVSGLIFLAVAPALEKQSFWHAVIAGAVIGLVAYGTYDLSNQATLKVWDAKLTVIDMCWGAFLSALASGVGYLAASRFT